VTSSPFGRPFVWATGLESTFIAQEGPGARRLDEYELTQHYTHWRQDLELAAGIGFDHIRYGVPWYRVEPAPGRFDWTFTDLVVPAMFELGLEPIIDLVHYGCPLWLDQQFAHRSYPQRVAAYAEAFARRYPRVRCYTPLNEPFVCADLTGYEGRWPPHLTGDAGFVQIATAVARGIVLTVNALRSVRPDAVIVQVEVPMTRLSADPRLTQRVSLDMARQYYAPELVLGRVDEDHFLHEYLTMHGCTDAALAWFRDNPVRLDVIGLNYYPDACVQRWIVGPDGRPTTVPVWGGGDYLESAVRDYWQRYHLPILVSETTVNERTAAMHAQWQSAPAGPSAWRDNWLSQLLAAVRSLGENAVPLVGVTWWPFIDAVGWDYRETVAHAAEHLEPAGLVALRYDGAGTMVRERLPVTEALRRAIAGFEWP
jgi:beta-glucosidase